MTPRGLASLLLVATLLGPACRSSEPRLDAETRRGLLEAIAALEYRASWSGGELQAPNRAHDLRTVFEADGVRVHDRTAPGSPLLVALRATRIGRSSALAPIPAGELHHEASRVEIRRPGLVEWYENRPDGLEQGFTLAQRPVGNGELVLALALDGAAAELNWNEVAFAARTSGRRLSYSKLVALDARGRTLPSRLELASDTDLRLVVDDADAAYPVVIDPLIGSGAETQLESNQLNAGLGASVAGAGDVNGDGYADVIVGAQAYDTGTADAGAAFVFHGRANGVASANPLGAAAILSSGAALSLFGASVAGAGDVNGDGYADVVVGAPLYAFRGFAFVFHGGSGGVGSGDAADADTLLDSGQSLAGLGQSVACAGDVNRDGYADVIVGAPNYANGQPSEGAAFVFLGGAGGIADVAAADAATQLESNGADRDFGTSVASAGDVNADGYADVIVGDPGFSSGQASEGGAFVFLGGALGIPDDVAAGADTTVEGNLANAFLGQSVASAGDVNGDGFADVIVGARGYDAGQNDEGAAFLFHGGPGGITSGSPASANARIESNQSGAQLGKSVSGAGDVSGDGYADVIVGAEFYDSGQSDEGAAFVFLGSIDGIGNSAPADAHAHVQADQADSNYGAAVAGAGDVNGDGYADVITGASGYSAGTSGEGAAFVYHGGGRTFLETPRFTWTSSGDLDLLGVSVAGAGDFDGDSYDDVIVGAPHYDGGQENEGAAFIVAGDQVLRFFAGTEPIELARLVRFESNQAGAEFGTSVAAAGDSDGDGYGDVIVGAPGWEDSVEDAGEGAAFVFRGSALPSDRTAAQADARFEANQPAALGASVSGLGDVDGDGLVEVIVGARFFFGAGSITDLPSGMAFIFEAGPNGFSSSGPEAAVTALDPGQADALMGGVVAGAGDVNGDGYADALVGSLLYDAGEVNEGAVFIYHGSPGGIASGGPSVAATRLESDQGNSRFGYGLASAGDVNGDGYADIIVGARFYRVDPSSGGAAFLFHGRAAGIASGNVSGAATALRTTDTSDSVNAVAGIGDANGDGLADVAVASHGFGVGGAVFVFQGRRSGIVSGALTNADAVLESSVVDASFGQSVAGGGDLNADGFADLVVGATGLGSGGAALVFHGNGGGTSEPLAPGAFVLHPQSITAHPWSWTANGLAVHQRLDAPEGLMLRALELEACPPGMPFGSAPCERTRSTWSYATFRQVSHVLPVPGTYRWRARSLRLPFYANPPDHPAAGPWRRLSAQAFEGDVRALPDADADDFVDRLDNCPTLANPTQADADSDSAGDVCDNCTSVANPRVAATFLAGAPWATLTGAQRDDDHDGYGNRCDGKFPGVAGTLIGAGDLTQFRASSGKNRTADACGTSGTRPCAIFDLDEAGTVIGAGDLTRFRTLSGKLPGPKCPTCPLPCTAGTTGTCGAIP